MTQTAKLFRNGRSQAVRLPKEFRFEGKEVAIRRDPATGAVILAPCPETKGQSPKATDGIAEPAASTAIFGDLVADRQAGLLLGSWEERFAVWDASGSLDDNALERNQTPPVERDFF
jgi:virulence-associated protein VagC